MYGRRLGREASGAAARRVRLPDLPACCSAAATTRRNEDPRASKNAAQDASRDPPVPLDSPRSLDSSPCLSCQLCFGLDALENMRCTLVDVTRGSISCSASPWRERRKYGDKLNESVVSSLHGVWHSNAGGADDVRCDWREAEPALASTRKSSQ